jgi:hypothetical protein
MKCKKVYLGQELTPQEWSYGLGSVYLAGPRNQKESSWRLEAMQKLEGAGSPLSFLIPESRHQLKGGFNKTPLPERYKWQHLGMSVATCILWWFPADVIDAQSYVEFGAWSKAERNFLGREKAEGNEYLDWLLHKDHLLYPAENMDQLVQMVIHWIRE